MRRLIDNVAYLQSSIERIRELFLSSEHTTDGLSKRMVSTAFLNSVPDAEASSVAQTDIIDLTVTKPESETGGERRRGKVPAHRKLSEANPSLRAALQDIMNLPAAPVSRKDVRQREVRVLGLHTKGN